MDESSQQKRFRSEEVTMPFSSGNSFHMGSYPMENQNWIQCEGCDTWRHLPDAVDMTALPEKWYCPMNIWDPLNNTCAGHKEFEQTPDSNVEKGQHMHYPTHAAPMVHPLQQIERAPVRDNSLAEVLGLKTVEKVKDLCRAYGIRTTRAGTNGGRKSKGELIDDLLAAGVTRIDDSFVKSMGKEKRKRTAPSAMPKQEFSSTVHSSDGASVSTTPMPPPGPPPRPPAEPPLVSLGSPKSTSSGRLDSLAEVACLALMEHKAATETTTHALSRDSYEALSGSTQMEPVSYRPFTSLAQARKVHQYVMEDNHMFHRPSMIQGSYPPQRHESSHRPSYGAPEESLSWEQVNAPSNMRSWA